MDPSQRLSNFDANYGFGYDSAGRPVYNNEFSLGKGNAARQATMAERRRLEILANQYDGGGLIRSLLAERNRNAARHSGVDHASWLDLSAGAGRSFVLPRT